MIVADINNTIIFLCTLFSSHILMVDKITVTSKTGYGTRIKNSFWKVFFGILFIIGAIILLVRNERNFVKQESALNEGKKEVISTVSSPIDTALDWELIYVNGTTHSPGEMLQDDIFWVKTDGLKLERRVEMYQRVEESTTTRKDNIWWSETTTTTYQYKKQWEDRAIDSSKFHESTNHENPVIWEYMPQTREKSPILLGDYTLTSSFTNQITNKTPIWLDAQEVIIPEKYKEASLDNLKKTHLSNSSIYIGADPQQAEIGDVKISFLTTNTWEISVIGQQKDWELIKYTTSNGKSISMLKNGKVGIDIMFATAEKTSKIRTWAKRASGLLLMFAWFSMLFAFVITLAKVIPALSRFLWFGVSIIALLLTVVIGWGMIALSRIAARPIIWITMLVIIIWVVTTAIIFGKKKTTPPTSTT